jgi:hypothetical protein
MYGGTCAGNTGRSRAARAAVDLDLAIGQFMLDDAMAAIQFATPSYGFQRLQHCSVRVSGRGLKDRIVQRCVGGSEFLEQGN